MHKIVDVSNVNGPHVNFAAIKAAGAGGVWLKVSEGTGFTDPDYRTNRRRAKQAGLLVGGYHFGHASNHPGAEAAHFLGLLELEPGDLLPVLDLEEQGRDGQPAPIVAAYAAGFFAAVEHKIGERALLYAGAFFVRDYGLSGLRERRWVPSYGARPGIGWVAWQFTDGQPRYPGSIDRLDTSKVPALALVTYKTPRRKRWAGLAKQAAHALAAILAAGPHPPARLWRRWWRLVIALHRKEKTP